MTALGYIRVSTDQQTHDQQRDRLTAAGVHPSALYAEHASGAKGRAGRPEFDRLLTDVREGDIILCTSLDRFGRNSAEVITTVADLAARGIYVRTLAEGIDTSTFNGQMVAGIFAVLAQWERSNIKARTDYAREAAKARGLQTGRPRKLSDADLRRARKLIDAGDSVRDVAKTMRVGKTTLYAALEREPARTGTDTARSA